MIIAEHCRAGSPRGEKHTPICDWPEDCYVQWGSSGIVFTGGKGMNYDIETIAKAISGDTESVKATVELLKQSYNTAFFEAFPKSPSTFIRGEGKTIEDAERQAFNKLTKYLACARHEFERRGYTNGAGFCKHCGLFKSKAFDPAPTTRT